MALGDLVRTIFVRLKEDGADEVKAAIDDVAARAKALSGTDATVKINVDKDGFLALRAMRTELAALTSAGDQAGVAALAARLKQFGDNTDSGRLKAAALALELRALKGAANDAAGNDSKGGGGIGGLAAALAGLGAGGGAGGGGGIASTVGIGALIAAPTGLLGIIPAAAAAAMGIVSFGALAYPTLTTVTGAVGDTHKQLLKLPEPTRQMVLDLKSLSAEFDGLATRFAPKLMPIITEGFLAASRIMHQMKPFADVAAGAIGDLLKQFNGFLSSPGFAAFRAQMLQLEGPAIRAIGEGIGQITVALGKLLIALANPAALRAFGILIKLAADAIVGLADVVSNATVFIIDAIHSIAVVFDELRHEAAAMGDGIASVFDSIKSWLSGFLDYWRQSFVQAGVDVKNWVNDVVQWFGALPGRINSALSGIPGDLFRIGQQAIQGLISGLQSMVGSLGSVGSSIGSALLGSLKSALGIFSPSKITYGHGQMIGQGLIDGMDSMHGPVAAAAARLAAAAGGGAAGYGAGGAAGGVTVVLNVPPGGAMLGQEFWTAFLKGVRVEYKAPLRQRLGIR